MMALRAIVVIMGLMILAGLTLLGAIVVSRVAHRPAATETAPAPQSFNGAAIDLPKGSRVEAMNIGSGRLVIDIVLPGEDRQILYITNSTALYQIKLGVPGFPD